MWLVINLYSYEVVCSLLFSLSLFLTSASLSPLPPPSPLFLARAHAHALSLSHTLSRIRQGSRSLLPSFPPSLLPSFPPSLLPSFPPSLLPSFPPSPLPPLSCFLQCTRVLARFLIHSCLLVIWLISALSLSFLFSHFLFCFGGPACRGACYICECHSRC